MKFDLPEQLQTDRLTLRLPRADDLPHWLAFTTSDRARFVGGGVGEDRTRLTRAFGHLAGLWLLRNAGTYIWEERGTGRVIGHGGLWYPLEWPEPELGWCVWCPEAEGRGFASEALRLIGRECFARLPHPSYVSYIDRANHASSALAKRLGAAIDPGAATPDTEDDISVWRHSKEGFAA